MQESRRNDFPTAACGGLRSTPDCRTRRTSLHLSHSCASPFGPAILVAHDPKAVITRIEIPQCSSLPHDGGVCLQLEDSIDAGARYVTSKSVSSSSAPLYS